jgi:hypothetical protein
MRPKGLCVFVPNIPVSLIKSQSQVPEVKLCECGCGNPTPHSKRFIHGHAARVQRRGSRKGPNPVEHRTDGASVVTLLKDGECIQCYLDTADYSLIESYHWRVFKSPHAVASYAASCGWLNGKKTTALFMHRLLMPDAPQVDHKDGNGLNNRRSNLRIADSTQQNANKPKRRGSHSSQFKGVHWVEKLGKFQARISTSEGRVSLGYFKNDVDAALAYDEAAVKYFGEFAKLNNVEAAAKKAA